MTEQTITLTLSLPEVNGVISSLANLPYGQVVALIDKIKSQADTQLAPPQAQPVPSTVTPATQV